MKAQRVVYLAGDGHGLATAYSGILKNGEVWVDNTPVVVADPTQVLPASGVEFTLPPGDYRSVHLNGLPVKRLICSGVRVRGDFVFDRAAKLRSIVCPDVVKGTLRIGGPKLRDIVWPHEIGNVKVTVRNKLRSFPRKVFGLFMVNGRESDVLPAISIFPSGCEYAGLETEVGGVAFLENPQKSVFRNKLILVGQGHKKHAVLA